MLIEEIFRSCVHEDVASVAVACIGRSFSVEISKAAARCGMTTGAFTVVAVQSFARREDEAEIRAVQVAMQRAQQPLLAGLQRILCIMLAATVGSDGECSSELQLCCEIGPLESVNVAAYRICAH